MCKSKAQTDHFHAWYSKDMIILAQNQYFAAEEM